ncbi:MAG: hypothetical protein R2710_17825 [Acidimicrobiales bacterium]
MVEQTLANIDVRRSARPGRARPTSSGPLPAARRLRLRGLLADALRSYFAEAKPAATMMVVGLADERMKIEIEVTALTPESHRYRGDGAHAGTSIGIEVTALTPERALV